MSDGEFCEADQKLPDGNADYETNNCEQQGLPEIFDVFQCDKGKYDVSNHT